MNTAAPNANRVDVCFGETLDRATMGRCQEILQKSFHKDPDRRGFYIPLPDDLLLRGEKKEARIDALLEQAKRRHERWHLAYDGNGVLVALSTTFVHTVKMVENGSKRDILALGDVATHPEYRGRGYGAAVLLAAFAEVNDELDVMLWQTGAAQGLYEKFGARVVPTDKIINSSISDPETQQPTLAFWDLVAMVYPSHPSKWDDKAVVDLMCVGW